MSEPDQSRATSRRVPRQQVFDIDKIMPQEPPPADPGEVARQLDSAAATQLQALLGLVNYLMQSCTTVLPEVTLRQFAVLRDQAGPVLNSYMARRQQVTLDLAEQLGMARRRVSDLQQMLAERDESSAKLEEKLAEFEAYANTAEPLFRR